MNTMHCNTNCCITCYTLWTCKYWTSNCSKTQINITHKIDCWNVVLRLFKCIAIIELCCLWCSKKYSIYSIALHRFACICICLCCCFVWFWSFWMNFAILWIVSIADTICISIGISQIAKSCCYLRNFPMNSLLSCAWVNLICCTRIFGWIDRANGCINWKNGTTWPSLSKKV